MSYVVMVRSHTEEERFFGAFRYRDRAKALADELAQFIDSLDDVETPAYAYVIHVESPVRAKAEELKEWMTHMMDGPA